MGHRTVRAGVGLKALLDRVGRDERGASLVEYALLVGLVTISVLALMIDFASWAHGMWTNFLSAVPR